MPRDTPVSSLPEDSLLLPLEPLTTPRFLRVLVELATYAYEQEAAETQETCTFLHCNAMDEDFFRLWTGSSSDGEKLTATCVRVTFLANEIEIEADVTDDNLIRFIYRCHSANYFTNFCSC